MIHDVNQQLKVLMIFADSSLKSGKADAEELRQLLQDAAVRNGKNVEIYATTARALSYFVSNDTSRIYDHKNKLDLKDYDFVYFRKAGSVMQQMLACAQYLESHGVPYADREIGVSTSRNKLSQMFMLQAKGVPIPTTLFVRNRKRLLRLVTTTYKDSIKWPVIAKATGGTRGDANFLVKTPQELEALLSENKRHFLIQSFIPNDGDFRAVVINGDLKALIKRVGKEGSHLNNTSKDGDAQWLPLDTISDSDREIAVRSAQIFKRDIAGVDILFDKTTNQPYILEVNRAPQVEHASFPEQKAEVLIEGIVDMINDYHEPTPASNLMTIGRRENVTLLAFPAIETMTAKIDTGAYSNALHVEYIEETTDENGKKILKFSPTGSDANVYETSHYATKKVVSSNGMAEQRFLVDMDIRINDTVYSGQFTLSDRSRMRVPMLIGRKFLKQHGFLVDAARRFTQ